MVSQPKTALIMIITRSPLRISLGGGGTDLPSFYEKFGGFLVAAAINKYVYIAIHQTFQPGLIIKYSSLEKVSSASEIQHPIIRETLRAFETDNSSLEIASLADIPSGTGLGSSGSFTTALLKALHTRRKHIVHPAELAEQACEIELNKLHEPIGKQDQYIAAYGGLTCFTFHKDNRVTAEPLQASRETVYDLEDHLLLFFTGFSRSASGILKDQKTRTQKNDDEMLKNLHYVKELGLRSRDALEAGNGEKFGQLMHEHWEHKKKRSGGMSNPKIDEWYELGMKNGAVGGKLVGAGGGGFLMFYAKDRQKLRHAMAKAGLEEVRFRFDFEGTKIVLND
jgi:D-glycero-alpha-D-manno-heptose-7-phosphate kinase